ncbi:hypothetical protein K443DRAFT_153443 [Laccaria amethystina LaAM-08-1]|uniref:Unplaced genomic scaffold K443scaffold_10, whole genome shotgun sequence n=1 Tax=Laccaria amethystina LaAM-08-1 TaxID=1095629 RepID=A0A0C9XSH1_9AGAR|nr:hypothetical protein K443DRAFT_153443 [Laccaria amethystina LaAM-08-1]
MSVLIQFYPPAHYPPSPHLSSIQSDISSLVNHSNQQEIPILCTIVRSPPLALPRTDSTSLPNFPTNLPQFSRTAKYFLHGLSGSSVLAYYPTFLSLFDSIHWKMRTWRHGCWML